MWLVRLTSVKVCIWIYIAKDLISFIVIRNTIVFMLIVRQTQLVKVGRTENQNFHLIRQTPSKFLSLISSHQNDTFQVSRRYKLNITILSKPKFIGLNLAHTMQQKRKFATVWCTQCVLHNFNVHCTMYYVDSAHYTNIRKKSLLISTILKMNRFRFHLYLFH